MNQNFKNINIEDVLFFDIETVRKSKELDINSKEFELYQRKIRNRETDELPTDTETVEHYRRFAALKMGFNKIVCGSVGRVIKGEVYIRSFIGGEDVILRGLYSKMKEARFISGFNILGFDIPMCRVNSLRHEGVSEMIPEIFNDSGKKIWNLDKIIELSDSVKGTHYSTMSLDEVCTHLEIPSPKEGDVEGSMVSETYYAGGIGKIMQYCARDVFAAINIFRRLQLQPIYEHFHDMNGPAVPEQKPLTVLEKIYRDNALTAEVKTGLEKILKKKKPTKKDREHLFTILRGAYVRTNFERNDQDSKAVIERKEKEINEFLSTVWA